MKKTLLSLFLLTTSLLLLGQQMPPLNDVVKEYVSKYSYNIEGSYIKFQKKKDGWHVVQIPYETPNKFQNDRLLWSKMTNSYEDIAYPKAEDNSKADSATVQECYTAANLAYEQYQYERNKYYGYAGWDWDIITDTLNEKPLNDSSYESLARAYSNYAMGYLYDQYGDLFINGDNDRQFLKDSDKVDQIRLKKFVAYDSKAIEVYKKLIQLNPNYQTKVGSVALKCANEHLFKYSSLKINGAIVDPKKLLEDVAYPDSIIEQSKKYLEKIPKNGIVFTGGDNDTYPLWYLQDFKNYRTDVLVINTSLLGLRRCLKMLDNNSKGTLFSTTDKTYYHSNFEYFLFDASLENKKPVSVKTFIEGIRKHTSKGETKEIKPVGEIVFEQGPEYKNETVRKYGEKEIYFKLKGDNKTSKVIKLNTIVYMNQLMMLDIINTNKNTRPILFTYFEEFFKDMLEPSGNIYRIVL